MGTQSRSSTANVAPPATMHERVAFGLLFALAFLMPFKFGLFSLDTLPPPFGPSIGALFSATASWPVEIAELLIALTAFFWLLDMIVTRRITFRFTTADGFLWAFLIIALIGSFFSILPHSAVTFMKQFACWAFLYHLVVNMPGGERRERALVSALLAGMMCASLIGLHQRLVGYEQIRQEVLQRVPPELQGQYMAILDRARVMSSFSSPNSLGGLYAMLLPAALVFVVVMRQWTRRYGELPAVLYCILGPVLAFGIFILTESKGAFISLGIVAIVVVITMGHRLRVPAWGRPAAIGLAIVVVTGLSFTSPGRRLLERGAHTFEERIGYWRGAAHIAADRSPGRNLIGTGFNSFGAMFPKYKDPKAVVGMAQYAHNNYVQLFIEVGVLGLAAFVAFWVTHLVRAGPVVGGFAHGEREVSFAVLVVLAAFFGLLAFLLHSIVDFDLYVPGLAMTAMLLLGLLVRHTGVLVEKTVVLRKELHAVIALAVLMVVAVAVIFFIPMPLTAEIHYFNARAILTGEAVNPPADRHGAAIGEMRQALQWDPLNQSYIAFLASIHQQRGVEQGSRDDFDKADAWYTRAIRLDPYRHQFVYRRAMVRLERMRLEGRIDWDPILTEFEHAVLLYPTDPHMRLLYTLRLDEAGRTEEAGKQFAEAARYDDANFSGALQTVREGYNDLSEIEAFMKSLDALRDKYGTPSSASRLDGEHGMRGGD
ncbi:MAG: O-antigen ligase family protein [Verrucomicrobia bacterium]|nr:O-antigen ligase family protein [Verrucomicrobiota bacterium]